MHRLKIILINFILIFKFPNFTHQIELFSGTTLMMVAGASWYFKDTINCKLSECCVIGPKNKWIDVNFKISDFNEKIFGQPIATQLVPRLIKKHLQDPKPKKPLVLSFHGYTGIGKNYLFDLIARKIYPRYNDTGESRFVQKYISTHMLNDNLQKSIANNLDKCGMGMILIDEIDKYPEKYLDDIYPLLDYVSPFPRAIFVLISNSGGSAINTQTKQIVLDGVHRNEIEYKHFDQLLNKEAFYDGGLKNSQLISRSVIDLFVPFLPLEYDHVEKCVVSYLKENYPNKVADKGFISTVMNQMEFVENYSLFGCKRVAAKVDILMN